MSALQKLQSSIDGLEKIGDDMQRDVVKEMLRKMEEEYEWLKATQEEARREEVLWDVYDWL